jgi:hypothetical protein
MDLQAVFSVLGPPDQTSHKVENKFHDHPFGSNGFGLSDVPLKNDYFLNYFKLGFDILIDGHDHAVRKLILYTNYPTHRLFGIYARCNFRIPCEQANITFSSTFEEVERVLGRGDRPIIQESKDHNSSPTQFHGFHNLIFETTAIQDAPRHILSVCIFDPK